jgi:FkbM family methyltransferase
VAPKPEISNQYFPKDIIKKKKGYRCIDCGAFDGDTARLMIEKGIKAEIIAFFEPDKNNYIRLSEYLAKNWKRVCKSYCIYPYGVYSKTSAMSFEAGKNAASGINKDGSATVMCVSIDDTVFGIKPDYIKMDIEGAEMEALDGAKNTIMKFRPTLVISIYHKPEHLWRIPLKIASLGLKYKYYIRSHGWNGFDLVLYAIPE